MNGASAAGSIDLGWSWGAKRGESQPRELKPGFQRVCKRPRANRAALHTAPRRARLLRWHTQLGPGDGGRGIGPTKHGLNQHAGKAKKMVARLWNCLRPPLPSRLFFFSPLLPPAHRSNTRTAFANLPQGRFSSFYCYPLPVGRFSRRIPARLASLSTTPGPAQPSPTRHPVVASPAVVWLTPSQNEARDSDRCISVLSDNSVTNSAGSSTRSLSPAARFGLRQRTRDPVPNLWSPLFPQHRCFGASTRALIENAVASGRQQEEPRKQQ